MLENPKQGRQIILETQLSQVFGELNVDPQNKRAIEIFLNPLRQKNPITHLHYEHCIRVALLARDIGKFIHLDEKALFFAGLLHDIGKSEIPVETLGKNGGWTNKDSQTLESHVINGYKAIKKKFPFTAEIIVRHHTFQKDGYPENLPPNLHNYDTETQTSILLHARMLALADVYDALHREDGKFGVKQKLSGIEIKDKMLELNSDKKELVEDLYRAKIFT